MSRIRRVTSYIIKRWRVNPEQWPLDTSDNTKAFNYAATLWSDCALELDGVVLENRPLPFPCPLNSEYHDSDYSVQLTQIEASTGNYQIFVSDITSTSFMAHVSNDSTGNQVLFFHVCATITKEALNHIMAGHTYNHSTGEWET